MSRVAIVDYQLCNVDSIRRALEVCGADAIITRNPAEVLAADRVVLPGVGAFAMAMANLKRDGLDEAMTEQAVARGRPFLGICLGMQLMARESDEDGPAAGLGWIDAQVVRFQPRQNERVPHIGWNEVTVAVDQPLLLGIEDGTDFYFVHSYHVVCAVEASVAATAPYCGTFTAAMTQGNLFGTQFHPEKSQKAGFKVLRNFLAL